MSYGSPKEKDTDRGPFSLTKKPKVFKKSRREKRNGPTKQQRKAAAFKEKQAENLRADSVIKQLFPPSSSAFGTGDVASARYPVAGLHLNKRSWNSQPMLSYYYETTPPSSKQLRAANKFFLAHPAKPLFCALKFHKQPMTWIPEVCFLGRSNAGKSSLLNALTGQKDLCSVSAQPGRTRHMAGYAVGGEQRDGKAGRVVMMDMPGYGEGSRHEWGKEILRYLARRKELRRVFVVIDAEVGLKSSDEEMLALLRQQGISHQIILGKVDKALLGFIKTRTGKNVKIISEEHDKANADALKEKVDEVMAVVRPKNGGGSGALGEILCVASEGGGGVRPTNKGLGLDALRWAILRATGLSWSGEFVDPEQLLAEEGSAYKAMWKRSADRRMQQWGEEALTEGGDEHDKKEVNEKEDVEEGEGWEDVYGKEGIDEDQERGRMTEDQGRYRTLRREAGEEETNTLAMETRPQVKASPKKQRKKRMPKASFQKRMEQEMRRPWQQKGT